ncbi:hypothetical protein ACPC54_38295 [Kitasatospora sp. NPDC094028]
MLPTYVVDHLYRLPVGAAAGAAYGAFFRYLAPHLARHGRLGRRPVLWGAAIGTAIGAAACTPLLRHAARVVLIDHPWWVEPALMAAAVPFLAAAIADFRRWERDNPEQTRES